MNRRRRTPIALLVALALAASACDGDDGSAASTAPPSASTTAVAPQASTTVPSQVTTTQETTTTTMGPTVVTSRNGALTVTVPAGAGPTDVTVEAVPVDLPEVLGLWEFGPDGATFSEPVEIVFTFDWDGDTPDVRFLTDGAPTGLEERPVEISVEGSSVTARTTVDHFSEGTMVDWSGDKAGTPQDSLGWNSSATVSEFVRDSFDLRGHILRFEVGRLEFYQATGPTEFTQANEAALDSEFASVADGEYLSVVDADLVDEAMRDLELEPEDAMPLVYLAVEDGPVMRCDSTATPTGGIWQQSDACQVLPSAGGGEVVALYDLTVAVVTPEELGVEDTFEEERLYAFYVAGTPLEISSDGTSFDDAAYRHHVFGFRGDGADGPVAVVVTTRQEDLERLSPGS